MGGGAGITVVVPLRDEERSFEALRRSIEAQSRAPDAVIFVDAGSTDGTVALAQAACRGHHGWEVFEAGPSTPGRARNLGIGTATTEWVALTDAGIVLDQFWLERLVRFAGATIDVVFGRYEPAPGSWFTECASLVYVAPAGTGPLGPMRDASVASCLLRRSVWDRAGRFPDLRAAEDRIFLRRLEALPARVALSPEATVWWQLQPTLRSTFGRFRNYSRVNALAGEQADWHHRVRRMYVVASFFVVLARLTDQRWLFVPVGGSFLRAGHAVWRRRESRSVRWALNPARLLSTLGITLAVDAATFTGWVEASIERSRT